MSMKIKINNSGIKDGSCLLSYRNTFLHLSTGPKLKESMTSITTTPFLSPPPTTWLACTRQCVNSTKLRNSTKTS